MKFHATSFYAVCSLTPVPFKVLYEICPYEIFATISTTLPYAPTDAFFGFLVPYLLRLDIRLETPAKSKAPRTK